MNFLRAVSSAAVRWVQQHQLWGHHGPLSWGVPVQAWGTWLASSACWGQCPNTRIGLCLCTICLCPSESNVSWCVPVLGQAAWQGRQKAVQVPTFPWGTNFPQTPALGASPGGCHSTRYPTKTRCPKNAIAMPTPWVKLGVGSPTVIPIHGIWILKPQYLRNFLLCPAGSAGFQDVCSPQLSAASP